MKKKTLCRINPERQYVKLTNVRDYPVQPRIDASALLDALPHGSGIDADWSLEVSPDGMSVECACSYHHMNSDGYYDGWTDFRFTVYIVRREVIEIDMRSGARRGMVDFCGMATGKNYALRFGRIIGAFPERYSDTRDYLGEVIDECLSERAKDILNYGKLEQAKEG